ncbi:MAG: hypothetical protein MJ213_05135 [Bacilli bacterium]|nr:hypothetical protein [Bacilli bacterium]
MKMHEISFYTKLNKQNNNILFFDRCIVQPIRYKKGKYKAINNRFFTCAEKKLYLKLVSPEFVYTTRRPCYHCLPVIRSQYYFDSGSIYNINCIPEINKVHDRVVYKYTRKLI